MTLMCEQCYDTNVDDKGRCAYCAGQMKDYDISDDISVPTCPRCGACLWSANDPDPDHHECILCTWGQKTRVAPHEIKDMEQWRRARPHPRKEGIDYECFQNE